MIIHNACDYKYSSTSTNVVDFWTKPIINTNHEFLQYTDSTDRSFQKKLPGNQMLPPEYPVVTLGRLVHSRQDQARSPPSEVRN